jgi:hypothetical protein
MEYDAVLLSQIFMKVPEDPSSHILRQMEAAGFYETLVSIYQTTRRHIPNDSDVENHSRGNLRSYSVLQSLFNEKRVNIVPATPLREVYNVALWSSMQTFNQLHWRRMEQKPIHE